MAIPVRQLALAFAALALSGCGGGTPDGPAAKSDVGTTAGGEEYKIYALKKLPAATQELPPLEDGKLHLSHPPLWKSMGRSSDYIIGLSRSTQADLPRIIVTAKPLPEQTIHTVTLENFDEFLQLIRDEVGDSAYEPVKGLLLGDRPYARYVKKVKFKIRNSLISGEKQVLKTLIDDRLFEIDLETYPEKLFESRNDAYSLAANLKFDGAPGNPMPTAEKPMDPPVEKPTEPAEPK